jgi:uroporphyrinogen decarboxylase
MNKTERVQATLAGHPVDRPPFAIWYHFGNQHASPEWTAQAHLDFFEHYDLDLLKVMNDYDYPMPPGMQVMETPADLRRLEPLDIPKTPLGSQLKALEKIAAALEAALRVVNDNLTRYALASLERGAAGIFLSVPATAESVTREQYARFMRPFDLKLLNAIRGKGTCHILHAHGEKLYLDQLLDYPVQVLSWADLNGGPSTPLTLMAGIDHVKFPYVSARVHREQVRAALAQAGPSRFILAPGCSVATYSFPPLIRAARDAGRR